MRVDMKKSMQYFKGFYVYRYKNYYDIGRNGTSCHTRITRKDRTIEEIREEIEKYIHEKNAQLEEQEASNG